MQFVLDKYFSNINMMKTTRVPKSLRIIFGLLLIFVYHLPRLFLLLCQYSFALVFNNGINLTADPKEHLKRARHLLNTKLNANILYCALDIRFALERMVHSKLLFANGVSKNNLKEYDPVKKFSVLKKLEDDIDFLHKVYVKIPETGELLLIGEYLPLESKEIARIKGKLGDLLHPKDGILLGIDNCDWYVDTRAFLLDAINYLEKRLQRNETFFAYKGLDRFHVEKIDILNHE